MDLTIPMERSLFERRTQELDHSQGEGRCSEGEPEDDFYVLANIM